jgi:3,4-dihydroxy 2-butanone 4-phosphate synthase/GTP cyclohydrolase II
MFPALVVDLVRAVGRAFYRDEHAAVLESLCRAPLRDDALHPTLGLAERQLRKILLDLQREKLVERVATFPVKTEIGEMTGYAYVTPFDTVNHFAFVHGRIGNGEEVVTRLHRANVLADTLGGGHEIRAALSRFQEAGRGVLVYLRDGAAGVPLQNLGSDAEEDNADAQRARQWREVGLGAQILRDLEVRSIINLSSKARAYVGLAGFGIEISDTKPLVD